VTTQATHITDYAQRGHDKRKLQVGFERVRRTGVMIDVDRCVLLPRHLHESRVRGEGSRRSTSILREALDNDHDPSDHGLGVILSKALLSTRAQSMIPNDTLTDLYV